jgi:hypothetical protein
LCGAPMNRPFSCRMPVPVGPSSTWSDTLMSSLLTNMLPKRSPAATVVRENEQAVFWSFINGEVNRFLHVHRLLDAMGTVSKYLIFSALTYSFSCSIVILYKSPSSLCSRKKKAPLRGRLSKIIDKGLSCFILCITAAVIMMHPSVSAA